MPRIQSVYVIILFILFMSPVARGVADNNPRLLNAYLVYFRGAALNEASISVFRNYDFVVMDRFRYHEVNQNTWSMLKQINPELKILLYQLGPVVRSDTDKMDVYYLNNIGRYDNPRKEDGQAINKGHQDWFLRNNYGNKAEISRDNYYLLDFGNSQFQDYWLEATANDILMQKWVADGIMVDLCVPYSQNPVDIVLGKRINKYPDPVLWDSAMNSFVTRIAGALNRSGQLVMVNRGYSNSETGFRAWIDLDGAVNPPDIALEEAAFVTSYGKTDARFYSEAEWLQQVSLAGRISNYSVAYMAHMKLHPGSKGLDNHGNAVNYDQLVQFIVGSYLLAKRSDGPKTYISYDYDRSKGAYRRFIDLSDFEEINLGNPSGSFARHGHVYVRKFDNGMVYVNPSAVSQDIRIETGGTLVTYSSVNGVTRTYTADDSKALAIPAHSSIIIENSQVPR